VGSDCRGCGGGTRPFVPRRQAPHPAQPWEATTELKLKPCCGPTALLHVSLQVEELSPECLGYAGLVYEHVLGEDKYTFVEDVRHPRSCTILVKGPNDHTIAQIKDAIRDGLRAVKNTQDDCAVVAGACLLAYMHAGATKHVALQSHQTMLLIAYRVLALWVVTRRGAGSSFAVMISSLQQADTVQQWGCTKYNTREASDLGCMQGTCLCTEATPLWTPAEYGCQAWRMEPWGCEGHHWLSPQPTDLPSVTAGVMPLNTDQSLLTIS
jgi:hypothetical protein